MDCGEIYGRIAVLSHDTVELMAIHHCTITRDRIDALKEEVGRVFGIREIISGDILFVTEEGWMLRKWTLWVEGVPFTRTPDLVNFADFSRAYDGAFCQYRHGKML